MIAKTAITTTGKVCINFYYYIKFGAVGQPLSSVNTQKRYLLYLAGRYLYPVYILNAYIFKVVRNLETGGAASRAPNLSKSPRSARQAI